MPGTRRDIFSRIDDWAENFEAPNILWIKGHPGIGKSAIASSLVENLRDSKRLGSSFFFRRERATVMTPKALWRTVAYDLARQYLAIRRHLVSELEADEAILSTINIDKLFHHLIHGPLVAGGEIFPVIVVDALDECGGLDGQHSDERKALMRTLSSWSRLPGRFKLIVTSRVETDIEQLFSRTSHHPLEICAGRDVTPQSSNDIRLFLEDELRQIAVQYTRTLTPDWPGYETINVLTTKSAGLFIWARTVVKFVTRGEPGEQLHRILEGGSTGDMSALYSWILNASFPSPSGDFLESLRLVLGGIIFAKAPLTAPSLERLFSITNSTLEYICNGLQSVMDSQGLMHFSHQSFVDFLLDPTRCPPNFLIDRRRESRSLTLACLHTMRDNLKFNICNLTSSYIRNAEVPNLKSQVEECIPPHLSYSCCFWASHLTETMFDNEVSDCLVYFTDHQFLFWLEVLSLVRQVKIASTMLGSLAGWIQVRAMTPYLLRNS